MTKYILQHHVFLRCNYEHNDKTKANLSYIVGKEHNENEVLIFSCRLFISENGDIKSKSTGVIISILPLLLKLKVLRF